MTLAITPYASMIPRVTAATEHARLKLIGWVIVPLGHSIWVASKGEDSASFKRGTADRNYVSAVTFAGLVEDCRRAEWEARQ